MRGHRFFGRRGKEPVDLYEDRAPGLYELTSASEQSEDAGDRLLDALSLVTVTTYQRSDRSWIVNFKPLALGPTVKSKIQNLTPPRTRSLPFRCSYRRSAK